MAPRLAAVGPHETDPEAILFADENAVRYLSAQLRSVGNTPHTVDLIQPPTSGEQPLRRLVLRTSDAPLCIRVEAEALAIEGDPTHLRRAADDLDGYADCNDVDEPGMHTHIDRKWQNVDNSWIADESVPLMVSGWVGES
jgi:hypothetical protein